MSSSSELQQFGRALIILLALLVFASCTVHPVRGAAAAAAVKGRSDSAAAAASQQEDQLTVIGAGLGRTGTASLKAALEAMGVGRTYHMYEVLWEQAELTAGHMQRWSQAGFDADSFEWDSIFVPGGAYRAAVDAPACAFFEPLMNKYKSAKVILTLRKNPASWVHSVHNSICSITNSTMSTVLRTVWPPEAQFHRFLSAFGWRFDVAPGRINHAAPTDDMYATFPWCESEEVAMELYSAWEAHVRATVPRERLVVLTTGQYGYDELAAALGVTLPSELAGQPIPHVNTRAEFVKVYYIKLTQTILLCGSPVALGVFLVWYCMLRPCKDGRPKKSRAGAGAVRVRAAKRKRAKVA